MTDRDDFLREHLSPPSDGGDAPAAGRLSRHGRPRTTTRTAATAWTTGPGNRSDADGRHTGDDAARRPPEEPNRPAGAENPRPRWTADTSRGPAGPQRIRAGRIPAGSAADHPPPAEPAPRAAPQR